MQQELHSSKREIGDLKFSVEDKEIEIKRLKKYKSENENKAEMVNEMQSDLQ